MFSKSANQAIGDADSISHLDPPRMGWFEARYDVSSWLNFFLLPWPYFFAFCDHMNDMFTYYVYLRMILLNFHTCLVPTV
jgi:hypothetical protein